MKYYLFSGELTAKGIRPLLEFLNETEGEITLGMDSEGGDTCVGCFLLDVLEAHSDRLVLVAAGRVYSAAMDLFCLYSGEKRVCRNAMGMVHLAYTNSEVNSTGLTDDETKAFMPMLKRAKKEDDKWVKRILTDDEFKRYNQGKEVYLDEARLRKLTRILPI